MRVLLTHMLKWDHQPERTSRSWENTTTEQRDRTERQLLAEYEAVLDTIETGLSAGNHAAAVALAAYPKKIRGFGHVKHAQANPALAERDRLLKAFAEAEPAPLAEAAE